MWCERRAQRNARALRVSLPSLLEESKPGDAKCHLWGREGDNPGPPWGDDKRLLLLIITCVRENLREESLGVMTSHLFALANVAFAGLRCSCKLVRRLSMLQTCRIKTR